MRHPLTWLVLLLLCASQTNAQSTLPPPASSQANFYLSVSDTTILTGITSFGGQVYPSFSVPGINSIIHQYQIARFQKAFPASRFEDMRRVYLVTASSADLATALNAGFPQYFPVFRNIAGPVWQGYFPNDWHLNHDGYLDFINAPDAWTVTKGDSNVVIGIADTYADVNNPDLRGKFAYVGLNYPQGPEWPHGTMVSGFAAGRTDNGYAYPSIGFNCRIDFVSYEGGGASILHNMALNRGRKILNASWIEGVSDGNAPVDYAAEYDDQEAYNEIYENGTFTVAAAGNGWSNGIDPKFKRTPALNKIADLSGQTVSTLKRIMYMKHNDESYVRIETKSAICQVLSKNLTEFENQNQ